MPTRSAPTAHPLAATAHPPLTCPPPPPRARRTSAAYPHTTVGSEGPRSLRGPRPPTSSAAAYPHTAVGSEGPRPLALGGPWPPPPTHLVISVTSAVAAAPHWSRCIGVRPHASPEPLHRSCCAGARRALLEPLGWSYYRPSTRRQGAIESLGSLCA
jgi:hypothetical protein